MYDRQPSARERHRAGSAQLKAGTAPQSAAPALERKLNVAHRGMGLSQRPARQAGAADDAAPDPQRTLSTLSTTRFSWPWSVSIVSQMSSLTLR